MTSDEKGQTQANAVEQFGRGDMLLGVLCAISVFVAVTLISDLGRGRAAALCAGVDFAVAKLRWESRRRPGFWFAISLILLLQMVVIAFVRFGGETMPVYGLLPAGLVVYLVDECIMFTFNRGGSIRPR